MAGDLSRRAFLGLRPCTRTWLSVVWKVGVLEKERDEEADEEETGVVTAPVRPNRLERTAVRGIFDVDGRVRDRSACSANREGISCIVVKLLFPAMVLINSFAGGRAMSYEGIGGCGRG